jgi:hypothetical protein
MLGATIFVIPSGTKPTEIHFETVPVRVSLHNTVLLMTVHERERPGDKMHELSKTENDADGTNPPNGVGLAVDGDVGEPVGDDVVGFAVGELVAPRFVGLGEVNTVGNGDGLVVGLGAATAFSVKAGVICTSLS